MKWIFTLAFLYLGSSVAQLFIRYPRQYLEAEPETALEQCDLLFDISKEDLEILRNEPSDANENLQRYLLCQVLFTNVVTPHLTINPDLLAENEKGLTNNKTKFFIKCFENAKNTGETVPHAIILKAFECLQKKIPEEEQNM